MNNYHSPSSNSNSKKKSLSGQILGRFSKKKFYLNRGGQQSKSSNTFATGNNTAVVIKDKKQGDRKIS